MMHPMEIICGTYSYQCMASPFQLRADDVASMVSVYGSGLSAGQAATAGNGAYTTASGTVTFPTGEGMAGVNVRVSRNAFGVVGFEGWSETSAVTGFMFNTNLRSPFVAAATGPSGSSGAATAAGWAITLPPIFRSTRGRVGESPDHDGAGECALPGVLLIRALCGGACGTVGVGADSGCVFHRRMGHLHGDCRADAAATCSDGEDGTPSAPMATPSTGWWTGLLCAYGHASYVAANVKPGRTFTIEVTALDGNGIPTEGKAMPVIGLFAASDGWGALPSLGG